MTEKSTPMTDETTGSADDGAATTGHRRLPAMKTDAKAVRTLAARVVWGVCVLFAVILAAAVLLTALEANESNSLVEFVDDTAARVDLGFFDLTNPIKEFDDAKQTVLFNYGLAAVAWLVIGRVLDRVVRP